MRQPTHIRAQDPDEGQTVENTAIFVYRAHALDKVEVLARILQARGRGLTMVFCRTKRTCDKVAEELADRGFASAAVHGDLGQGAREQALRAFRSGKIDVLIATDVAARGIDVQDVTHVINYQCPDDERTFLHRIGRTGRAGAKGTAVTFVDWDEIPKWNLINKALELDHADPIETYSSSKHLYTDLDIPEGTKGHLPRSAQTRAGLEAEQVEDLGETGRKPKPRKAAPAKEGRSGVAPDHDGPALPKRTGEPRKRTRGSGAATGSGTAVTFSEAETTTSTPEAAGEGGGARRRRRGGRGRGGGGSGSGGGVKPAAE
jgi:superfamily II DNA/RNA helicase